jgi:hypothetical protein
MHFGGNFAIDLGKKKGPGYWPGPSFVSVTCVYGSRTRKNSWVAEVLFV